MATKLFINGVWVDAEDGKTFATYAPATGVGRELSELGYNEYRQVKHLWRSTAVDRSGYAHFAVLSPNL
jgi:acyl-CoA reductase-like NAD-dependent aldehyde dehydrogenase